MVFTHDSACIFWLAFYWYSEFIWSFLITPSDFLIDQQWEISNSEVLHWLTQQKVPLKKLGLALGF